MAVVRNLMVRAGMDASGLSRGARAAQTSMNGLQRSLSTSMSGINKTLSLVKTALITLGIGKMVKDATQVAVGFESAFGQINRMLGENATEFNNWATTQGKAYGYSLSEAYKYGSTYSNLLSSFTSGTAENAQQTESLLKATAITASMTGRTIDDVGERIRSGLLGNTESIEDLGINVNVALLETSKAFEQFANGRSWQQLTFQEQQQIRLMAILDQVSTKYGDNLANNTATRQMQFVAALNNVKLALGQAFLPIYNIILPALTSFMNGLATVLNYVAQFMTALFGSKVSQSANTQTAAIQSQAGAVDGLADAYDSAGASAKKAKGVLSGIDEINSISQADAGSGSAGAGGVGGASGIQTPSINTSATDGAIVKVSQKVQALAEKIKKVFGSVTKFISDNWVVISSVIAGIVAFIAGLFIGGKWSIIVGAISTVIGYIQLIPTALGLAAIAISSPMVIIAAIIGAVVGAIVYLWQTSEDFRNDVMVIIDGITSVLSRLWNEILKPLFSFVSDVFVTILKPIAIFIATVIVDAVAGVMKILSALWKNILEPIVNFIIDIFAIALEGLIDIWNAWKPAIDVVFKALMWIYENAIKPIASFIGGIFISVIEGFGSTIGDVLGAVKNIFKGLIDFIVGIFTGDWSRAWDGVVSIFGGIMDGLGTVIKAPLNGVIWLINKAIQGLNKITIPDWVPSWLGGGQGINIPQIPYLAKGGIVSSPTLAMVGEAGKEAVVPLENNTQGLDLLASKLMDRLGGTSGNGDLILQIDGSVIGKVALNQLRRMQRQGNVTLIPV